MENQSEKRTVDFLWLSSNTIGKIEESDNQNIINIRLHLRDICVSRFEAIGVAEKASERAARGICPKCLANWGIEAGPIARISSLPHQRHRVNSLSTCSGLSKYQKKLKNLKTNYRDNILVLTCKNCGHVSRVPCKKPSKVSLLNECIEEDKCILTERKEETSSKNKVKKRKKKDSFAGLNASYVTPKRVDKKKSENFKNLVKNELMITPVVHKNITNGSNLEFNTEKLQQLDNSSIEVKVFDNKETSNEIVDGSYATQKTPKMHLKQINNSPLGSFNFSTKDHRKKAKRKRSVKNYLKSESKKGNSCLSKFISFLDS